MRLSSSTDRLSSVCRHSAAAPMTEARLASHSTVMSWTCLSRRPKRAASSSGIASTAAHTAALGALLVGRSGHLAMASSVSVESMCAHSTGSFWAAVFSSPAILSRKPPRLDSRVRSIVVEIIDGLELARRRSTSLAMTFRPCTTARPVWSVASCSSSVSLPAKALSTSRTD